MSDAQSSRKENFVVCIRNDGYDASLEKRKIYVAIPDKAAAQQQCVRVIDESGEDYVYPAEYFVTISLPADVEEALAKAG